MNNWIELTTYGSSKPTYVIPASVIGIVGCEWGSTIRLEGGGECSVQEDPQAVRSKISEQMKK